MGILDRNQVQEIRFKKGDYIIYEPTQSQKEDINNLLESQNIELKESSIEGEVDTRFIRFILKECTSLGSEVDEYTDEELDIKMANGNRNTILFMNSIEELCNELVEDYFYIKEKEIKLLIKIIDILNMNTTKTDMEIKFNNLMKRNKIKVTLNDFVENKDNPEKLKEIIKNSKKKNAKKK